MMQREHLVAGTVLALVLVSVASPGGAASAVSAERQRELRAQIEAWERQVDGVPVPDLLAALADARTLATEAGVDVGRLDRHYDVGKKVIRMGAFRAPGTPTPGSFGLPATVEAAIAEDEASRTEYRVRLMKRLTVAHLRALVGSAEEPPPCSPSLDAGTARIDGTVVPLAGCFDPHLDGLRRYAAAIGRIQSAEADALLGELELLVGEQQFATDVIAGVPLVGEAIDVYSLYAGESLAGVEMHALERALTVVMLALPFVGPKAAQFLSQAIERSPRAGAALAKLKAWLDAVIDWAAWAGEKAAPHADAVKARVAALWDGSAEALRPLRDLLDQALQRHADRVDPVTRDQWFIWQKLRDAAQDRIDIADLPPEWRERTLRHAAQVLDEGVGEVTRQLTREQRIRAAGMLTAHGEAFSHVARQRGEIFIVRAVNPDAMRLIAQDAGTKGMNVKAKSATHGVIAGAIPVDQALNKTGSALSGARARLRDAAPGSPDARHWQQQVAELEANVAEGVKAMEACRKKNCAAEVPFTRPDGKVVHQAADPSSGDVQFLVEASPGSWVDAATGQAARLPSGAAPSQVMVLADPATGRMLTADYDLLAFGKKGRHSEPGFNPDTGYITREQSAALEDLNAAVRGQDPRFDPRSHGGKPYEGGNVVHHGAEENFHLSPGAEGDVFTAFEPDGSIISIPTCDAACMRKWCSGLGPGGEPRCDPTRLCGPGETRDCLPVDPDRLLKDYFHVKRLEGTNVDPNTRWGWGPYNALGGWLGSLHCKGCDPALWPR